MTSTPNFEDINGWEPLNSEIELHVQKVKFENSKTYFLPSKQFTKND